MPPTVRSLIRLAWPVVVSRSSQVVVGVTDAIMVAHLGEAAIAATTTGAVNVFNLLILPMGLVFIVSSFASQFTGERDPAGARRYGWYGLGVALLAQVLCIAVIAGVPDFLRAIGHRGAVRVPGRVRLAWHEFARTLRFGLPVGMNWFFDFLAFSFFINVLMGGLGTTTLAALMIVIQINSVSFMPAFGIASAGAILVGQAIGASRHSDVPPLVKMTAKVVGVWQGTVGLAYLAFPRLFMAPFIDERTATPELLEIGTTMLMLSACC